VAGFDRLPDVTNLLITPAELNAALESPTPPKLIDVRWSLTGPPGIGAYRAGHLPGAVFADLDTELSGRRGAAGRHPLPLAADFEQLMRRLGIDDASSVVVYDAGDSVPASRAWWDLNYFGHPQVQVLDGGVAAWVGAGLPLVTDEPEVAAGDFTAVAGQLPILDADAAGALAHDGVLVDVRAGERYRGEVEPVDAVAGHIPGAINLPTAANLQPDGRFVDPSTLRARFAALPTEGVGVYCGSGVNAAHTAFAMTLAGLPTPALFVGSWSNWIADGSRPIGVGAE
jgi:thiosulfate/3-mercaptopyruvate sulfurtransferase